MPATPATPDEELECQPDVSHLPYASIEHMTMQERAYDALRAKRAVQRAERERLA